VTYHRIRFDLLPILASIMLAGACRAPEGTGERFEITVVDGRHLNTS
jgi:hypothetical protein